MLKLKKICTAELNNLRLSFNFIFFHFSKCHSNVLPTIGVSEEDRGPPVDHDIRKFMKLAVTDDDKNKIESVILEYQAAKNAKRRVPSYLCDEHMKELLVMPSKSQRCKYLRFLHKRERYKINKIKKRVVVEIKPPPVEDDHIRYGLGHNTLFTSLTKSRIQKLYKMRQLYLMPFCQNIVIDLDYDDFMVSWESKNCALQLCEICSANRQHRYPFNLFFCNAHSSKRIVQYLEKSFVSLYDDCSITCSSSSYLDLFPKAKLVYLSPHADEVMKCYNQEAIYIIGGFVDKTNKTHVSFEKAKKEGILSCRLPLDEYVDWKSGSKSLTLDQVVKILLEMKLTDDWKQAFRFLPQRKVKQTC